LYIRARQKFDQLHSFNVLSKIADGTLGWPENGPYDAIIVTASGPEIPAALVDQLVDQGNMVIPVGPRESQELQVVTKQGREIRTRTIESVRFVSLIGAQGWGQ
jgi:protein-L-isoaspartate(D-aspartate) O-methyltransferase